MITSLLQQIDSHRKFFYATNRAVEIVTRADGLVYHFTSGRSRELTFGSAIVKVPGIHTKGNIERPGLNLFLLSVLVVKFEPEDPAKHFVVRDFRVLTKEEFAQEIRDTGATSALLYVHGFHTALEDALYTLAQIKFDTGYTGVAVAFSWPSGDNYLSYFYGATGISVSRKPFLDVLDLLKNSAHVEKIYVIAHSLGSGLVADALANELHPKMHLKELIMAAPDIDVDVFRTLENGIRRAADAVTLYAASSDVALHLSEIVSQQSRVGAIAQPDDQLARPGIEIIDVTAVANDIFGFNHSMFSTKRTLLDDIGQILLDGKHPPNLRSPGGFFGVPEGSKTPFYWRIPE
jgi:esterase/lipase superfamily enzyme